MPETGKKVLKTILIIILIFLMYTVVGGILIYLKDYKVLPTDVLDINTSTYYSDETGPDRVTLLEEGESALTARFNLIENAEETIEIANFKFVTGEVTDNLYGLLLERADEGIKIRLLMDGLAHNLKGPLNEMFWAIASNPNIEVRFYEPFSILHPWRLNNRLHDKIIIVDNKTVLTGGRNLADSYYLKDAEGRYAYDRDIAIFKDINSLNQQNSVIKDYSAYYDELWHHEFTQMIEEEKRLSFEDTGIEGKEKLISSLEDARDRSEFYIDTKIDWNNLSYETQKISLVTNPLERMKKNPVILQTLNALMQEAEEQIIIQSPYMIWNSELQKIAQLQNIDTPIHILTNSETSTDNLPGIAGFLNLKDDLTDHVTQIYGFQGNSSIHAKSFVIDNRLSVIGSFNFDPRSAFLSTENIVIIDSQAVTEELTANIIELMGTSKIYRENKPILPEAVEDPDEMNGFDRALLRIIQILVYPFDELL